MRVTVTGGCGFIGSHLVDALVERGDEVTILDNLSTGSEENIQNALLSDAAAFRFGSVLDRDDVRAAVTDAELVYHLAAVVGVSRYVSEPAWTIETNTQGTAIVAEVCGLNGISLVLTSTSEVYGKTTKLPMSEDDPLVFGAPGIPRWSYGLSKAVDEQLVFGLARRYKTSAYIARLFNTVGPRQIGHYGMVMPRFIAQALAGEPLTVVRPGTQTRTFCHVADTVRALLALPTVPEAAGQVVNIGSNQAVTIEHLAHGIIRQLASPSVVSYVDAEDIYGPGYEDTERRCPDITKARELIGWKPSIVVSQIIDDIARSWQMSDEQTKELVYPAVV